MFAIASLLYEIMSGRKPFKGLTDNVCLLIHLTSFNYFLVGCFCAEQN